MTLSTNVEKIGEEAVPLMIMIFLGWFLAHFRPAYFPAEMVGSFNRFIFNISIPCLVFKGLATRHLPDLDWDFVAVFMLLRVFFGIISAVVTFIPLFRQTKIDFTADFLTNYIGTTWINTIIFGLPLLQSLYGKPVAILNILASFSSFIFQLPVMLVLFELRELRRQREEPPAAVEEGKAIVKDTSIKMVEMASPLSYSHVTFFPVDGGAPQPEDTNNKWSKTNNNGSTKPLFSVPVAPNKAPTPGKAGDNVLAPHHRVVVDVLLKVLRNPPFLGICAGLLWSFIIRWAGHDKNFPVYIDKWVQYFSDVVTPLAAFSVGMFMNNHLSSIVLHWRQNLLLIFTKMVLVPALTIPICLMLGIDGIEGRSAVLIACLPIAVASFALGHNYMIKERWPVEILASQIVIGTILMPLVFIAWHAFMEAVELFGKIPDGAIYHPK